MSLEPVSPELRSFVVERARHLCEYCLMREDHLYTGCEVDHIVSRKHGGATSEANLAYACMTCNRAKGSDIATTKPLTSEIVRLYNPRTDRWSDHFELDEDGIRFVGRTDVGDCTIRLLRMNQPERLIERRILAQKNQFPSPEALRLIAGD